MKKFKKPELVVAEFEVEDIMTDPSATGTKDPDEMGGMPLTRSNDPLGDLIN